MKNKELLLEAIANYSPFSPSQKKVMKILVQIAIDERVVIDVIELIRISSLSRISVYNALKIFEEENFIEKLNVKGSKKGVFILKPIKLEEIIKHYNARKNIKI